MCTQMMSFNPFEDTCGAFENDELLDIMLDGDETATMDCDGHTAELLRQGAEAAKEVRASQRERESEELQRMVENGDFDEDETNWREDEEFEQTLCSALVGDDNRPACEPCNPFDDGGDDDGVGILEEKQLPVDSWEEIDEQEEDARACLLATKAGAEFLMDAEIRRVVVLQEEELEESLKQIYQESEWVRLFGDFKRCFRFSLDITPNKAATPLLDAIYAWGVARKYEKTVLDNALRTAVRRTTTEENRIAEAQVFVDVVCSMLPDADINSEAQLSLEQAIAPFAGPQWSDITRHFEAIDSPVVTQHVSQLMETLVQYENVVPWHVFKQSTELAVPAWELLETLAHENIRHAQSREVFSVLVRDFPYAVWFYYDKLSELFKLVSQECDRMKRNGPLIEEQGIRMLISIVTMGAHVGFAPTLMVALGNRFVASLARSESKDQHFLLAAPTGTGKTETMITMMQEFAKYCETHGRKCIVIYSSLLNALNDQTKSTVNKIPQIPRSGNTPELNKLPWRWEAFTSNQLRYIRTSDNEPAKKRFRNALMGEDPVLICSTAHSLHLVTDMLNPYRHKNMYALFILDEVNQLAASIGAHENAVQNSKIVTNLLALFGQRSPLEIRHFVGACAFNGCAGSVRMPLLQLLSQAIAHYRTRGAPAFYHIGATLAAPSVAQRLDSTCVSAVWSGTERKESNRRIILAVTAHLLMALVPEAVAKDEAEATYNRSSVTFFSTNAESRAVTKCVTWIMQSIFGANGDKKITQTKYYPPKSLVLPVLSPVNTAKDNMNNMSSKLAMMAQVATKIATNPPPELKSMSVTYAATPTMGAGVSIALDLPGVFQARDEVFWKERLMVWLNYVDRKIRWVEDLLANQHIFPPDIYAEFLEERRLVENAIRHMESFTPVLEENTTLFETLETDEARTDRLYALWCKEFDSVMNSLRRIGYGVCIVNTLPNRGVGTQQLLQEQARLRNASEVILFMQKKNPDPSHKIKVCGVRASDGPKHLAGLESSLSHRARQLRSRKLMMWSDESLPLHTLEQLARADRKATNAVSDPGALAHEDFTVKEKYTPRQKFEYACLSAKRERATSDSVLMALHRNINASVQILSTDLSVVLRMWATLSHPGTPWTHALRCVTMATQAVHRLQKTGLAANCFVPAHFKPTIETFKDKAIDIIAMRRMHQYAQSFRNSEMLRQIRQGLVSEIAVDDKNEADAIHAQKMAAALARAQEPPPPPNVTEAEAIRMYHTDDVRRVLLETQKRKTTCFELLLQRLGMVHPAHMSRLVNGGLEIHALCVAQSLAFGSIRDSKNFHPDPFTNALALGVNCVLMQAFQQGYAKATEEFPFPDVFPAPGTVAREMVRNGNDPFQIVVRTSVATGEQLGIVQWLLFAVEQFLMARKGAQWMKKSCPTDEGSMNFRPPQAKVDAMVGQLCMKLGRYPFNITTPGADVWHKDFLMTPLPGMTDAQILQWSEATQFRRVQMLKKRDVAIEVRRRKHTLDAAGQPMAKLTKQEIAAMMVVTPEELLKDETGNPTHHALLREVFAQDQTKDETKEARRILLCEDFNTADPTGSTLHVTLSADPGAVVLSLEMQKRVLAVQLNEMIDLVYDDDMPGQTGTFVLNKTNPLAPPELPDLRRLVAEAEMQATAEGNLEAGEMLFEDEHGEAIQMQNEREEDACDEEADHEGNLADFVVGDEADDTRESMVSVGASGIALEATTSAVEIDDNTRAPRAIPKKKEVYLDEEEKRGLLTVTETKTKRGRKRGSSKSPTTALPTAPKRSRLIPIRDDESISAMSTKSASFLRGERTKGTPTMESDRLTMHDIDNDGDTRSSFLEDFGNDRLSFASGMSSGSSQASANDGDSKARREKRMRFWNRDTGQFEYQ